MENAKRFQELAATMASEAGVLSWEYTNGLYGRAWSRQKRIRAPKPTTRRRLFIWAHECAHVALEHQDSGKPVHRQEYEAEKWAIEAFRRHGVPIPRRSLTKAKHYVAETIRRAVVGGANHIDSEANRWATTSVRRPSRKP
jgi:hypothetical protein